MGVLAPLTVRDTVNREVIHRVSSVPQLVEYIATRGTMAGLGVVTACGKPERIGDNFMEAYESATAVTCLECLAF